MSKIILQQKTNKVDIKSITTLPAAEGLIADSLQIIQTELLRYSKKTQSGKSLDLREARVLQGYIKSLVELSKESRERAKDEDFDKLSSQELEELLRILVEKRKSDNSQDSSEK